MGSDIIQHCVILYASICPVKVNELCKVYANKMEAPRVVPNIIGGLDNINAAHVIATNTDGHQIIVGAAANGAAVTGNPVLLAGSDGTNTQTIKTDNTGELIVRSIKNVFTA